VKPNYRVYIAAYSNGRRAWDSPTNLANPKEPDGAAAPKHCAATPAFVINRKSN